MIDITAVDAEYERLVAREGLYDYAFFGFNATPKIRSTLRRLHRQARRIVERRNREPRIEKVRDWRNNDGSRYLGKGW